jgi:general secretion pathway protein E
VISRIKIMANLDIAGAPPAAGRPHPLRVQGKEIDLRVSTVPTMHGESVVMRILDKGGVALDFQKLGFFDDTLKGLHRRADAAARHPARHRDLPARARRRRSTPRSIA